jgi:type VI secretion system protein ImpM
MAGAPVGFFGKLPSHGDFIARRVDDLFQDRWDEWLQRSIAESQRTLGGAWLDCYLTGPLWRFFLCDGVAGAGCFSGVLMPSVDRVGRYFPLTVVAQLPTDLAPLTFADTARAWFESIEDLCVDALQATNFDLAAFDAAVAASGAMLGSAETTNAFHKDAHQWRWAITDAADIDGAFGRALLRTAQDALRPMSMWWTAGSEHVQPSVLLTRHLPRPDSFAALLDGRWDQGGWHGDLIPVAVPVPAQSYEEPPVAFFEVQSAGATDCGTVRAENQDCYALQDGNRLWAVADGMGGHRDGAVASRMVADALYSLEPTTSVNTALESVRIALERVNADLRRSALVRETGATSGSTAVVLAIRGAQYAICWAGDSRAYLYREGALTQLTRDHVNIPLAEDIGADVLQTLARGSTEITRAVGGDDVLELDHVVDTLAPGDRFLLCSDGLYVALELETLMTHLRLQSPQEAADKLIAEACRVGAPDNVTAVVVDVQALAPGS